MNARCTGHLGQTLDGALNIFPGHHHQVGHLVYHHDNERHGLEREFLLFINRLTGFFIVAGLHRTGQHLIIFDGLLDPLIKAGNVPYTKF